MTQVYFTLNSDEIQKIIADSDTDDLAKEILTTIFNQLMDMSDQRHGKVNGMVITSVNTPPELTRLN